MSPRARTILKRLLAAAGLVLLWLALSAIATWKLTRRSATKAEPAWEGVEAIRLRASDGIECGAWLIPGDSAKPVVLLLHGNGVSRTHFSGLMRFLAEQHDGVMAVSLRAHGDSDGSVNDFGLSARLDVIAAVQFLAGRFPGRPVVIVGESLGSGAAIFAAKECAGVRAYLFAAPYTDLDTAVWNRCRYRLPPLLSHAAYAGLRLWAPVFFPVSVHAVRPIDHIAEIPESVPVVIVASEGDQLTRIDEVRAMQAKIASHSTLVAFKEGGHGEFLTKHEAEYRQAIIDLVGAVK